MTVMEQGTTPRRPVIKVDVWSDIQCPWCYIGKRHLEDAVERFDGVVAVEYHSFELAPDAPRDVDVDQVMKARAGLRPGQQHPGLSQLLAAAENVGIEFDFDSIQATNSALAHQLVHLAKAHGRQHEAEERLFQAYFSNGEHIGRLGVLLGIAEEIGVDREEARQALENNEYLAAVRADEAEAASSGATGVPLFVFDDAYGLSGAQHPDTILAVLQQIEQERA